VGSRKYGKSERGLNLALEKSVVGRRNQNCVLPTRGSSLGNETPRQMLTQRVLTFAQQSESVHMADSFWDYFQKFREEHQYEHERGKEAMSAFMYLQRFLEPNWTDEATRTHPIRNMLRVSGGGFDAVLIGFAMRLSALEKIDGYPSVVKRLANPREFASAEAEIETGLRFVLAGFEVSFIVPTPKERTPDIRVTKKGQETYIEVTSVSQPEENMRAMNLNGEIFRLMNDRMTGGGGFLSTLPSVREIEDLRQRIEEARKKALDCNCVVKVHLPGLGLIFIAPKAKLADVPRNYIGSFYLNTQTPLPHPEKIARKIREKGKRQCSSSEATLLVVYDRLMSPEALTKMLENSGEEEIALVTDSFPCMLGTALVIPWRSYQHEPIPTEAQLDGDRLYLYNSLPYDLTESIILWKNRHSERRLANDCVEAFAEYPKLLSDLLSKPFNVES